MIESKYYTYNIFGLILKSEIPFDELVPSTSTDYQISLSLASAKHPFNNFENVKDQLVVYKQNKHMFCLRLKDIVDFLLIHEIGLTDIKVDIKDIERMPIIKSWLFGSVFSAALILNNRFALHASAISVDEKLVLFSGHSGAGKSTLATQLRSRGYAMYSDDKCVLEKSKDSSGFELMHSLKITRLWENSIAKLDDKTFLSNPEKIVGKGEKYQFLLDESDQTKTSPKLAAIFVLVDSIKATKITIREVLKSKKIVVLRNQTHRLNYIKGFKKNPSHLEFINSLAKEIRIFRVFRPQNTDIDTFVDFIENQINQL